MNTVDWCDVDWQLGAKARRALQASAVETSGRAGVYVVAREVMNRVNISDPEEFRAIAEFLENEDLIAEADADYGVFVLTLEGIDIAEHQREACGPSGNGGFGASREEDSTNLSSSRKNATGRPREPKSSGYRL